MENIAYATFGLELKAIQHMARIEDELKSKFESEQQKAMLNIMFTANWLRSAQVDLFKPFGISPQQYNILRILKGAKTKVNMHNVKDRMIDRSPNATRLADKLISKGLVERERCEEDRRVVYVRISAKGIELLQSIERKGRAMTERVTQHLTGPSAAELNHLLDTLRG